MEDPEFHVGEEDVEPGEAQIGALAAEAGDRGGGIVELLEALGAGEGKEEVFVAGGIQVEEALGAEGVVFEGSDLVVGEGAVEGEESGHGFGGVEGEDLEGGRGRGFVVEVEEMEGVIGGAFDGAGEPRHGCNNHGLRGLETEDY